LLLIVGTQVTPRAAASSSSWSGCFWGLSERDRCGGGRRCRVKEGLFLDPGDSCRCVGGVNVEHAQRSEHERR